jgi:hypothetical protein
MTASCFLTLHLFGLPSKRQLICDMGHHGQTSNHLSMHSIDPELEKCRVPLVQISWSLTLFSRILNVDQGALNAGCSEAKKLARHIFLTQWSFAPHFLFQLKAH